MTRVVITGIGAVTPVGNDAESSWEAMKAGRSGVGPITTRGRVNIKDWK